MINMNVARSITSAATLTMLILSSPALRGQDKVTYDDHVQPIFRSKCFSCHNTNKKSSDLDLSSYTSMMQGGASGEAVVPGSPDDSYLFSLISHESEPYMPPNSEKIADDLIGTVRTWIEQGALENKSSKAMIAKPTVDLAVSISAGTRPEGPPPLPDVLDMQPVVRTERTTAVTAIATSPWAPVIAVAGQKQVILYHSQTLQPMGILTFPEGQAQVLKFSRNGRLLLAGGGQGAANGIVALWDISTGERLATVGDELDSVMAADISPDQTMVALGGPSKLIRIYRISDGAMLHEIKKHTEWIYALEFSPDGVLLATGDRNGGLQVWEAHTGREYLTLNGHGGAINDVSWRLDSNVLASASADQSVKLWEMENGGQIKSFTANGGGVESVEFTRDGRLVTCGRDRVTKLFDQNGAEQKSFEAFSDLALAVSYCDETNRVIAGDWTGEVRVWNAEDATRLGDLSTNPLSLADRLAQSTAALQEAEAQATATGAAYAAAQAGVAEQQKLIDAATVAMAETKKQHTAAVAAAEAAAKLLTEYQTKKQTQDQRMTALVNALPQLQSGLDSAKAAVASGANGEDVKKVIAELEKHLADRSTERDQLAEALKTTTTEIETATTGKAAADKLVVDLAAKATVVEADVVAKTAALAPLVEAAQGAKATADVASATVQQHQTDITRWQNYVALHEELAALNATKQAQIDAEAKAAEAAAELAAMEQAVAAAETARAAIAQKLAEQQKTLGELTALDQTLKSKSKDLTVLIDQHTKAIPMLQEAEQKVRLASEAIASDDGLKVTLAGLTTVVQQSTERMAKLKAEMEATAVAQAKAVADLAATNQLIAAETTAMTEADKGMAAAVAAVAPVAEIVSASQAELASAVAATEAAAAIVESRRNTLRPLTGSAQASR